MSAFIRMFSRFGLLSGVIVLESPFRGYYPDTAPNSVNIMSLHHQNLKSFSAAYDI